MRYAVKKNDPLRIPVEPITKQKAKKIKETMADLAQHMVVECDKKTTGADLHHMGFIEEGPRLIHLTQVLEDQAQLVEAISNSMG